MALKEKRKGSYLESYTLPDVNHLLVLIQSKQVVNIYYRNYQTATQLRTEFSLLTLNFQSYLHAQIVEFCQDSKVTCNLISTQPVLLSSAPSTCHDVANSGLP